MSWLSAIWRWLTSLFKKGKPVTAPDKFNVTGSWDKASYNGGDTITGAISGSAVKSTTTNSTVGPVTVPLVAADGSKTTITFPAVPAVITTVQSESVVIDTSQPIVDNGPLKLAFTATADKLHMTAQVPTTLPS